MLPYLLSEYEAAQLLGWGPSNLRHFRRMLCEGREDCAPPFIRFGRQIRYERDAVLRFGAARGLRPDGALRLDPDPRIAPAIVVDEHPDTWLTEAEVCGVLRVSRRTGRGMRADWHRGHDAFPPHYLEGGGRPRIYVRFGSLATWIRRRRSTLTLTQAIESRA